MKLRATGLVTSLLFMAGCSVTPQKLTLNEMNAINAQDRAAIESQIQPIQGELSLEEAIARALKYNLDQRLRMLEQSLAAGEMEAGRFDMLPKLLANAGYDWRDSYSQRWEAPNDTPVDFDTTGPLPTISLDPEHTTWDLHLSWNILDFGASYYTAKQNANKLLIANERRRKAMHLLIQNVRQVYWRALAAESLSVQVRSTLDSAERALTDSEKLSNERVSAPETALRFQRNLLENMRLLESVERELAAARIELARLMGLAPGQAFKLIEPKSEISTLDIAMEDLEARALINNADLRVEVLNSKIAVDETHKAILKLLPGISFNYGTYADTDRYLIKESWRAAGVQVSYNLFHLLSAKSRLNLADQQEALAEAKRMALQMSVLTQVHLAVHQLNDTQKQYNRAASIAKVDRQLESLVQGGVAGRVASEQSKIAANVTTILSELRRYQAMSKYQEASGQLQATLGLEPAIGSLDTMSLDDLTLVIAPWVNGNIVDELHEKTSSKADVDVVSAGESI